jgi:hypothetical protein
MNGDSILIRCLVGDDSELGEAEAELLSASCAGAVVSTIFIGLALKTFTRKAHALYVPPRLPVLAACRLFRLCERNRLGLPGRLGRWSLGEYWDFDPTDLLLPSLSEVRSTTLRTNSLGELEEDLSGLSFSVLFKEVGVGSW